ncbi:hypothetical protein FRACA_2500005 [Frankia canadensis]|uniref:Uncharacterized protein n=1 Tax=Frankia canadensis TaxID=1836972 RepID=A0A2I2KS28_9ACTN|nr:hypothetical protein FRACA_2500005 [Frankia canadensis]SOU55767.1 hypothetical protein FRACA_2500005 [Frankia canadensis]
MPLRYACPSNLASDQRVCAGRGYGRQARRGTDHESVVASEPLAACLRLWSRDAPQQLAVPSASDAASYRRQIKDLTRSPLTERQVGQLFDARRTVPAHTAPNPTRARV